jgi:N-acetylglucosaminyldiphosphoundecaprenol N-acetyl-beta-D-mannosaminyltransferase
MKVTDSSVRVLGIDVADVDMEATLSRIAALLQQSRKGYICAASVHGVMEAHRCARLAQIYSESELTIPDGMPLVWVGWMRGRAKMRRVTGPDVMLEVFRRREFAGVKHFLYGGVDGVAEELRERLEACFPWVQIVGVATPPFHALSTVEEQELMTTVSDLKPDIIWVGLGCPKQELFMARCLPMLDATLLFGVGAAFDFHTGRIRDCAQWMKLAGLQWLDRLVQDPRRLWRRYLRNNTAFLWHIGLELVGLRLARDEVRSGRSHEQTREGTCDEEQLQHLHEA